MHVDRRIGLDVQSRTGQHLRQVLGWLEIRGPNGQHDWATLLGDLIGQLRGLRQQQCGLTIVGERHQEGGLTLWAVLDWMTEA